MPAHAHASRADARLDPRAPFVLDTRELGRRPGSMRRVQRTVPAPADLRGELVGVPAGEPIALELRLEAVMEGVLVSGTAHAPVQGECGRCLAPVTTEAEVDIQQLFAYPDEDVPADDADTDRLHGDLLDLEPAVRDALVLDLPLTPLCRPDCPGLCPDCGVPLAEAGPDHGHDRTDPRWAALGGLLAPADVRRTDEEEN